MALENKARLPSTVIANTIFDDDGKFLYSTQNPTKTQKPQKPLLKELCGPRKQYLWQPTKYGGNKHGVRLRREASISMAVAKTSILSYFFWIIYLTGTVDSAQQKYRNIWAVKVRGSLQDAKQLSFKHGFVYDKHVSFPS